MRTLGFFSTLTALLAAAQLSPTSAWAATAESRAKYRKEAEEIPKAPTAPPRFRHTPPADVIRCERHYLSNGKSYDCDSYSRFDGEGLLKAVQDTPDAVAYIESYQRTRRFSQIAAYTATGGIAIAGLAYLGSKFLFSQSDSNSVAFRNIGVGGGLLLTISALIAGFVTMSTNDIKIDHAVDAYNQAHPDRHIQLEMKSGFSF